MLKGVILFTMYILKITDNTERRKRDMSKTLKTAVSSGKKPSFECRIYSHLTNKEEHKDHECLPFTGKIRKFRLECKWKDYFGSPDWKISEINGTS